MPNSRFPHGLNYLLLTIAMFFWGLSWPITKLLVAQATSLQIGFFRFFIAGVAYGTVYIFLNRKNQQKFSLKSFLQYGLLGFLGIFGYGILFLTAMRYTTSAQGAVIAGIQPSIISIMASIIHKERLIPKWRYGGLVFSFLGVIIIIGVQAFVNFNRDHFIGNLLVIIAFLLFASYSVYGKTVMKEHHPFETTMWATIMGAVLFAIPAIVENKWQDLAIKDPIFWGEILVLALGTTVVGFYFYFFAIQRIGATKSGIFINLVPVFGTLASIWLLHETPSWTLWVGMGCISIGIFLINYPITTKEEALSCD